MMGTGRPHAQTLHRMGEMSGMRAPSCGGACVHRKKA
jgi:hypothetical protein